MSHSQLNADAGPSTLVSSSASVSSAGNLCATPAAHQASAAVVSISACAGNCGSDDLVTVDEILTIVNIALGNTPLLDREAADANHDGQVAVDETLTAVNTALNGCGWGR